MSLRVSDKSTELNYKHATLLNTVLFMSVNTTDVFYAVDKKGVYTPNYIKWNHGMENQAAFVVFLVTLLKIMFISLKSCQV